ncbi:MAG: hypothetical protein WAL79_03330 [Nitrososphaeraceae archaeon]
MRCTKRDVVVEILLILNIATFVLFLPLEQKDNQNARGDGFAQETLPPFNLNGEKLLLYTKVSPSIIQAEDRQNRYLDIMVTDYDTEELVQNASYKIMIYKDNEIIMEGKFHSESGPLKITIEPMDGNLKVTKFTSLSNGTWTTETGDITIQGPVFINPGLYHLSITILGLGNTKDVMEVPSSGLIFDTWLSVADAKNNIVEYEGTKYNITVISYYDLIDGFSFIPPTKTILWTMPFDWNMSRIKHQNILVHEEVKVPSSLFNGSVSQYGASVNDIPIFGRSLTIDPFSSQNNTIVHILINKQDISKFLNQGIINVNDRKMSFKLTLLQSAKLESSSELETENGEVSISLVTIPEKLTAGSKADLILRFNDPAARVPINADVTYGLKILAPDGKPIVNQTSQTAIYNTTGKIQVTFPTKGIYQIVISIDGLAPIDSDTLDTSRNSIARGYLLVE